MRIRIKRLSMSVLALTLAAIVALPGAALAVGTLDQQQTVDGGTRGASDFCVAQTFTAGLTGVLDRVSLYVRDADQLVDTDLVVEIRDSAGGALGSTVLASQTVDRDSVPDGAFDWVDVDFGAPASVIAGVQYSVTATQSVAADSDRFQIAAAQDQPSGALYTAGQAFYDSAPCAPATQPWAGGTVDLMFRTYVTVPPPPDTIQPAGDIGGPCADPWYYGIFDNTASTVALQFRFRWYTRSGITTVKKIVPAGAIYRTKLRWVKPFTPIFVGYFDPALNKWVNLASERSVKGRYPPCEYQRGFEYPN